MSALLWSHFGKHLFLYKKKKNYEEFFRSKFDILFDDIYCGTFLLSKFVSPMHFSHLLFLFLLSLSKIFWTLDETLTCNIYFMYSMYGFFFLQFVNFIVVQNLVILKGKMHILSACNTYIILNMTQNCFVYYVLVTFCQNIFFSFLFFFPVLFCEANLAIFWDEIQWNICITLTR